MVDRLSRLALLPVLLPLFAALLFSVPVRCGALVNASRVEAGPLHHYASPVQRLAFGSCNRQDKAQPLWSAIARAAPSAFVHLGDAVYADRHVPYIPFIRWPGEPAHVQRVYEEQLRQHEYRAFLERGLPLLAVWDDHDYGENDGDVRTPHKAEAQALFLDFIGAHQADVRRTREGLYTSYTLGPEGQRVKVILLDVRYFQDPDPATRDLLGDAQWRWLEEELGYAQSGAEHCVHGVEEGTVECDAAGRRIRPDFLVIGSSIQLGALQFGALHRRLGEGWRHFPRSRQRLLRLLHASALDCPVLFLSGDVHYGEVFRTDHCVNGSAGASSSSSSSTMSVLPVIDVTSSGLTHSIGRQLSLPLTQLVMPRLLGKPTDRGQQFGTGMDRLCTDLNFGLVDFDWAHHTARVRIMAPDNNACIDVTFDWAELRRTSLPLDGVAWPQWQAAGGKHPLSSSAGGMEQRLARCEYEREESAVVRMHVSGLRGLVSLVAGLVLLLLVLLYFALRVLLEAVAWLLRSIGLRQAGRSRKKRQ